MELQKNMFQFWQAWVFHKHLYGCIISIRNGCFDQRAGSEQLTQILVFRPFETSLCEERKLLKKSILCEGEKTFFFKSKDRISNLLKMTQMNTP